MFDNEYFILFRETDDNIPRLSIMNRSEDQLFEGGVLSGAPLFFENSYRDEDIRLGRLERLTQVLFDGSDWIVTDSVKALLDELGADHIQLFPAVYVANNGSKFDQYWYVNFLRQTDCWDRDQSVYTPPADPSDPYDYAEVKQYVLDSDVLADCSEAERQLFKMDGANVSYVFIHQYIWNLIKVLPELGVKAISVADYRRGAQYR